MYYETVAVAVRLTIALLGLVAVVQLMLLPHCAAVFRQKMFGLRRRLFLLMVDGHINASDPVYTRLRTSLNGLIRTAERITFLRVVLIAALFANTTKTYRETDAAAIDAITNEHTRKQICALRDEMYDVIVRHVIFTSPLAMGLLVVLILLALIVAVFQQLTRAKKGITKALHRLIMKKIRDRIPVDTIAVEGELLADDAVVA